MKIILMVERLLSFTFLQKSDRYGRNLLNVKWYESLNYVMTYIIMYVIMYIIYDNVYGNVCDMQSGCSWETECLNVVIYPETKYKWKGYF